MSGREPATQNVIEDDLKITVRGKITATQGGRTIPLRPRERAVLAAIALAHPHPIDTDRIVELIWTNSEPPTARKAVHNHISRVRAVAPSLIETAAHGYRFGPDVLIDRVRHPADSSRPLADLPDSPEVEAHRRRLAATIAAEEEHGFETEMSADATPELIDRLHASLVTEPYRERRWYLLALAQHRLGARRDALQTIDESRRRLVEVGLVPGELLRSLEREILHDEPVAPAASVPPSGSGGEVLHPHRNDPFVGRRRQLGLIDQVWQSTVADRRPRLLLIEGPPGVGKTRLVDEFTRTGLDVGGVARVMIVRHRPDQRGAYQSLTDTVRRLAWRGDATEQAHRLLDELEALDSAGATTLSSPLRAFVDLVEALADKPSIWIIDDAQWASADSLELLARVFEHVAAPALLIMTARPVGDHVNVLPTLSQALATDRIQLSEFTRHETAELLAASLPSAGLDADDLRRVHDRTGGLPLYTSEIARMSRLTGRVETDGVPGVIREWLQERIDRLPPAVAEVALFAAVIGSVDIDAIAAATGRTRHDVIEACDQLLTSGVLTIADPGGRFRLSHDMTRDVVYDSIGPTRRAAMHRTIARYLSTRGEAAPATLAHHLLRSGSEATREAAVAAIEAGRRELHVGAWRAAERWFRAAMGVADRDTERAGASAGLGRALLGLEQYGSATEALMEAIDLARLEGLPLVQADATLALAGRAGRGAHHIADDEELTELLRSALAHLGRSSAIADERARTIAIGRVERELAISLLLVDAPGERRRLLTRQVDRIRSLDPPEPSELAAALLAARYAKLGGEQLEERIADLDEVLAIPSRSLGPERLLTAYCYLHEDLLRRGDHPGALAALSDAEGIVRRYPHRYWHWVTRTWRALHHVVTGELEAAERMAAEAAALRPEIPEAAACLAVTTVNLRLYQGRADEVIPMLETATRQHPNIPAYRATLTLCAAEAGDHDRARHHLDWFTRADLCNLPHDTNRFLGLAVLGHAAATIGDVAAGDVLAAELGAFSGQWVVVACYGGGGAIWGPTDHVLGRLAAARGDHAAAGSLLAGAWSQARHAPLIAERIRVDTDALSGCAVAAHQR